MQRAYDVLVVGSGIAGLSFARKVAAMGHKVCILTKKDRAESNTNYAQGGIAAVTSQSDDFEIHVYSTQESSLRSNSICIWLECQGWLASAALRRVSPKEE